MARVSRQHPRRYGATRRHAAPGGMPWRHVAARHGGAAALQSEPVRPGGNGAPGGAGELGRCDRAKMLDSRRAQIRRLPGRNLAVAPGIGRIHRFRADGRRLALAFSRILEKSAVAAGAKGCNTHCLALYLLRRATNSRLAFERKESQMIKAAAFGFVVVACLWLPSVAYLAAKGMIGPDGLTVADTLQHTATLLAGAPVSTALASLIPVSD